MLLQKDKNSVTKLVDALERKGYVLREQNPEDRRSNTVFLTRKAEALKDDAKTKGVYILERMLTGISDDELKIFLDTLGKLCSNMNVSDNDE